MRSLRFVAAPNPFKGSLGSPAAALAIARGVQAAIPQATVDEVPIADGGEGTVEALLAARGGTLVQVRVEGPLGEPVDASFAIIDKGRSAVVELAAASGLSLVAEERRDPRRASTYGFGQLLEEARRRGVGRVIAGIGGSATNDGGAGMAQALGFRLLDAGGRDLARGGAALAALDRIDDSGLDLGWRDVSVEVAVDVTNPLTGPDGASAVYGPQKGATPEMVRELDAGLRRFAEVIGQDIANRPGAGAAGGTGAGLVYFLSAELRRGAPLVIEAAGLDRALIGADAVITGEGRLDGQSMYGKGPIEVAHRARRHGVPALLIAGGLGAGWEVVFEHGVTVVETLSPEAGLTLAEMEANAADLIAVAAARAAAKFAHPRG